MIITRTPFRVSFFGGGTDYPAWYREHGGMVLSTTINKYCYINCRYLPPFFDIKYLIRYSKREETRTLADIAHSSVRECLHFLGIEEGIEMVHTSDIPARSGIGSSSSFTVGLLNSLYALKGQMTTKRQLAREAIHVEQSVIGENVGCQDQVAASFGGFNKIEFGNGHEFYVYPVTISSDKLETFQDHLMLFFTGFSRNATDIAAEQIKLIPKKKVELMEMMAMVDRGIDILNGNISNIEDFGTLLHESWMLKRSLSDIISNSTIDAIYETARNAGCLGGKLLGAGSGGFLLLFAPPGIQHRIKEKLRGLMHVPFRFENLGSQVVLYSTQDLK